MLAQVLERQQAYNVFFKTQLCAESVTYKLPNRFCVVGVKWDVEACSAGGCEPAHVFWQFLAVVMKYKLKYRLFSLDTSLNIL
jgi:hypothetical protein